LSYSQLGQDLWIEEVTDKKQNGFFVELGARNGILTSNTLYLENNLNWAGILVECCPNNYKKLKLAGRKCRLDNRAISDKSNKKINFYTGLSSGVGSVYKNEQFTKTNPVVVKTVTLSDLLKEHNAPYNIDYISMDIEGAEELALKGFGWDYKVKFWTIESGNWMNRYEMGRRKRIREIMFKHKYKVVPGKHQEVEDWFYLQE